MRFFQLAQRYNHASRLARAHDLTGELSSLAQQAPPKMMVESAAYFEERGMMAQAVELYQKVRARARARLRDSARRKVRAELRVRARALPEGELSLLVRPIRRGTRGAPSTCASATGSSTGCATSPTASPPPPSAPTPRCCSGAPTFFLTQAPKP